MDMHNVKEQISHSGFAIIDNIFTFSEISRIIDCIDTTNTSNPNFRKSHELFAIRRFLYEVPAVKKLLFTPLFTTLVNQLFGIGYFIVKSIYFDKPAASNWFVAYHQDLTISVSEKADCAGFGPWTVKQEQFAVQPPIAILENNYTIRIHLDDTTGENGALRVIPGSHRTGIWKQSNIDRKTETACTVSRGGLMIMKPLLLHASGRSTNNMRRRVIHIEFSNQQLPPPLTWSEALPGTYFTKTPESP
jgi:ectoine hydroxylase-related dioxygenase (phytanoyl-CoA dioxygenase family)